MNSRSVYGLLVGLVVLSLLMVWMVPFYSERIPAVLVGHVKTQVHDAGHQWAQFTAQGRDLILSGKAPMPKARQEVLDIAHNVPGIRSVTDKITPRIVSPYTFGITWKDKQLVSNGFLPDEESLGRIKQLLHSLFGENAQSELQVGNGNPAGWRQLTDVLIRTLPEFEHATIDLIDKNLDLSGKIASSSQRKQLLELLAPYREQGYNLNLHIVAADVLAIRCQQEFDSLLKQSIVFASGKDYINQDSFPLLESLAETALFCPDEVITVMGHTDNQGSPAINKKLSQQRADSVVEWLIRADVDKNRLKAIGYGSERPIADNRTEAGRAKNRRIEFKVGAQ